MSKTRGMPTDEELADALYEHLRQRGEVGDTLTGVHAQKYLAERFGLEGYAPVTASARAFKKLQAQGRVERPPGRTPEGKNRGVVLITG